MPRPRVTKERRFVHSDLDSYGTPFSQTISNARIIEDPRGIQYPNDIKSPKPELITDIENGIFRYDLDFLMQFNNFCKEKPRMLPLSHLGLERVDPQSVRLGNPSNRKSNFRVISPETTTASGSPENVALNVPLIRSSTTTIPEVQIPIPYHRTRSHRGSGKMKAQKDTTPSSWRITSNSQNIARGIQTLSLVPEVTPLNPTKPGSWNRESLQFHSNSPEFIQCKVLGMLNKLTRTNFDSISDQLIKLTNKSALENPGTFVQIVRLVYKVVTSQTTPWSEIYAQLCHKMMRETSNDTRSDGGGAPCGGQLFRKYLLDQSKEAFKTAVQSTDCVNKNCQKAALYSDEYYAIHKVKRQGLGLVQFMGELFKASIITERIVHDSIKTLIGGVLGPREDNLERLCILMTNTGKVLDTPKAHAHMDVYFSRIKEIYTINNKEVCLRIRFMLLDVIELREKGWIPRVRKVPVPLTPNGVVKKKNKRE